MRATYRPRQMHDFAVLLTPDEARAMLRELETVSPVERETLALVYAKLSKTVARAAERNS